VGAVRDQILDVLYAKSGGLAAYAKKIAKAREFPEVVKIGDDSCRNWPRELVEDHVKLDTVFAAHVFPQWPKRAAMWLSLIVEWLRGSIHEGIPLNFCFVLADLSQIRDSSSFEIVPITGLSLVSPWGSDGSASNESAVPKILDRIKQQITKNNYSWFQEGRYALLWDATFPQSEPRYLVRLVDSSWDVFVTRCRHANPPTTHTIAGLVGYVRADGSGGVILRGKPILSFRKTGAWTRGYSEKEGWLQKKLIGAGIRNHDDKAKRLLKACLAVSEDPHMGAMVIVLKNRYRDPKYAHFPFRSMGKLWDVEDVGELRKASVSEMISLMAMDGATCVFRDLEGKTRLTFRRLARVSGEGIDRRLSESAKEKLEGEGSRKWSGALAACRADVRLVLAISQDGPIMAFSRHNGMIEADHHS